MLTLTAGRIRLGAVTEQARTSEQRHEDELKAVEARHADQLAAVAEEKAQLAKELEEKLKSLEKAREQRDQYKESNRSNFKVAKQLELDLIASRQETRDLEGRVEDLEKTNAANLERYKNATLRCFYDFWKHNQGANFDYLPENAREVELARCAAQLAEEERSRVPASPEISLAAGMEGANNEAVDQNLPQDPPAPQAP